MDLTALAEITTGYLIKLVADSTIKTTTAEAIKSLKGGITKLFKGKKKEEKALRNLEKYPEDADFQQDFNEVMVTALEDPEVLEEVKVLLDQVETATGIPHQQMIVNKNVSKIKGNGNINIQGSTSSNITINTPPKKD